MRLYALIAVPALALLRCASDPSGSTAAGGLSGGKNPTAGQAHDGGDAGQRHSGGSIAVDLGGQGGEPAPPEVTAGAAGDGEPSAAGAGGEPTSSGGKAGAAGSGGVSSGSGGGGTGGTETGGVSGGGSGGTGGTAEQSWYSRCYGLGDSDSAFCLDAKPNNRNEWSCEPGPAPNGQCTRANDNDTPETRRWCCPRCIAEPSMNYPSLAGGCSKSHTAFIACSGLAGPFQGCVATIYGWCC